MVYVVVYFCQRSIRILKTIKNYSTNEDEPKIFNKSLGKYFEIYNKKHFPNEYPLIIAALESKLASTCSNSVKRTIKKALKPNLIICFVIYTFETFLRCCFLFTSSKK